MSLLQNARAECGGLGQVRGALELLRTVREFTPNVEMPWWKDALDAAPKLLQPAASMLQSAAALRAAGKTGNFASAMSPSAVPGVPAAAAPTQARPSQPAAPYSVSPAEDEADRSAAGHLDDAAVHQLLGEFAPLILNRMMQGGDGGESAEGLVMTYGPMPIEKAVAVGEERILSGLRAHPQLWPRFQPYEERLVTFVRGPFAYVEQESEHGDDSAPSNDALASETD